MSVYSPGISLWICFASLIIIIEIQHLFMVLLVLPFSLYELPTSSLAIFLIRLFFSCSLSLLLPCSLALSLIYRNSLYILATNSSSIICVNKYLPQFVLRFFQFSIWYMMNRREIKSWSMDSLSLTQKFQVAVQNTMPVYILPPSSEFFISVNVLFSSKISTWSFSFL